MSDFFVTLVLKTVVYFSKLLDFQYFESLELEHSESNSYIIDRNYLFKTNLFVGRQFFNAFKTENVIP